MSGDVDIAILGGGFAGSLLAMIARRHGHSVALLERGRHPRFAIGESTTPLANLVLEELAAEHGLARLAPLAKWGSWRREHPELACGLKRGFTFLRHREGQPWRSTPEHDDELLVAASPHAGIADTHWFRADLDRFLFEAALESGAVGVEGFEAVRIAEERNGMAIHGRAGGREIRLRAGFVFDATGPRGALHGALGLGEAADAELPPSEALFAHFEGVRTTAEVAGVPAGTPYPPDDAAVHHVFEGGWIWVLRFSNGSVSAGASLQRPLARELAVEEGEAAWRRLLGRLPTLQAQFAGAEAVTGFRHLPRMAFRSARIAGERWALLPSAHGFVDPLLSTGIPLTLLGIQRLGKLLRLEPATPAWREAMAAYEASTESEFLAASGLVGAMLANLGRFPVFRELSLLYFAAASFAEAARRLGRPGLAEGFLLQENPGFRAARERLCERARGAMTADEQARWSEELRRAIEPYDVAGLGDRARRHHHPATAADLRRAAGKLGASVAEVDALLERCGFAVDPAPPRGGVDG